METLAGLVSTSASGSTEWERALCDLALRRASGWGEPGSISGHWEAVAGETG